MFAAPVDMTDSTPDIHAMKHLLPVFLFLAAFGATAVLAGGSLRAETAPPGRAAMAALQWADPLIAHLTTLQTLRGQFDQEQAEHPGPVVVNFFASWCPPCGPEAAALTELAAEWEPQGVRFLSINLFEDFGGVHKPERLQRFLDRYKADFPVLRGTEETAALFGGVDRIPTVFVFNADGSVELLFVHERNAEVMHAEQDVIATAIERAMARGT